MLTTIGVGNSQEALKTNQCQERHFVSAFEEKVSLYCLPIHHLNSLVIVHRQHRWVSARDAGCDAKVDGIPNMPPLHFAQPPR